MAETRHDVVGIGNAIVDVLAHADDAFIAANGLQKGNMTLVDAETAESLYEKMGPGVAVSGGSAANTIAALASLGGKGGFIGKVRDDQLGAIFRHDIVSLGITFNTRPAAEGPSTARCLILVTPDAHRTMQTFLGISSELGPDDIDESLIASSKITYLEGYLWDRPKAKEAFVKAAKVAHEAGRQVALTTAGNSNQVITKVARPPRTSTAVSSQPMLKKAVSVRRKPTPSHNNAKMAADAPTLIQTTRRMFGSLN